MRENGVQKGAKIHEKSRKNDTKTRSEKSLKQNILKHLPPPNPALGNLQGREPPEKKPKERKPSRKGNLLSREPS